MFDGLVLLCWDILVWMIFGDWWMLIWMLVDVWMCTRSWLGEYDNWYIFGDCLDFKFGC